MNLCNRAPQLYCTKLQANEEEEHARIHDLEHIISDDDDTKNIVQRYKTKMESAGRQNSQPHKFRSSLTAHKRLGIVSKNKAKLEQDVKRNEERLQREREILHIQQELHSGSVRQKLEEWLVASTEAMDALVMVDEAAKLFDQMYDSSQYKASLPSPQHDFGTKLQAMQAFSFNDNSVSDLDDAPSDTDRLTGQDLAMNYECPPKIIRTQESTLLEESKDQELSSESNVGSSKRIKSLELQNQELLIKTRHKEAELDEWKSKAKRISVACLALAKDVEEREKSIQELKDSNKAKEERIISLQAQQKNPRSTNHDICRPIDTNRRSRKFSARASRNPSLSGSLMKASLTGGSISEQIQEEAKIEILALEERLKAMDDEKSDLLQELKAMKSILADTSDQRQGNKKERLVYQLSCKKCNKHMNFIGSTEYDLKTTVERHFDNVVKATMEGKSRRRSSTGLAELVRRRSSTVDCEEKLECEDWSSEFANHFARHCQPTLKFKSVSAKSVISFCQQNVKVELLKRRDGSQLFWE